MRTVAQRIKDIGTAKLLIMKPGKWFWVVERCYQLCFAAVYEISANFELTEEIELVFKNCRK